MRGPMRLHGRVRQDHDAVVNGHDRELVHGVSLPVDMAGHARVGADGNVKTAERLVHVGARREPDLHD